MIGLNTVDSNGNASSSSIEYMAWSNDYVDTSLKNYNMVPITENTSQIVDSYNNYGFIPSDIFLDLQSIADPKACYYFDDYNKFIPSPYLGDDKTLNPDYCKTISGYNNALSDFNGLSNTQTLVGLGSDYVAANAAWKYSDGVSSTQWYLPAMGELGFLMARFNAINETIREIGGIELVFGYNFCSSSEYDGYYVYSLETDSGAVSNYHKDDYFWMRPFGLL